MEIGDHQYSCTHCQHTWEGEQDHICSKTIETHELKEAPDKLGHGNITSYTDLNGNVVWVKFDSHDQFECIDCAWTRNGMTCFKIRDEDKKKSLVAIQDLMNEMRECGFYRCSSCGEDFEGEPAGHPLFAGINCPECWKQHQQNMDEERRKGHVCGMCRKPYGECYC